MTSIKTKKSLPPCPCPLPCFVMVLMLALLLAPSCAKAEAIRYVEDPAYQTLSPEEEYPMDELIRMAENNDVRAQFIVADLFYKGKGGLAKNRLKGRYWFERAAKQGYPHAFLRLAALSKRENKAIESYRWYIIAEKIAKSDKMRQFISHQMAELEVSAKMSKHDLKTADAQAKAWQQQRIKEQRALEEELKKLEEEKEKAQKEKEKADAEAGKKSPATADQNKSPEKNKPSPAKGENTTPQTPTRNGELNG